MPPKKAKLSRPKQRDILDQANVVEGRRKRVPSARAQEAQTDCSGDEHTTQHAPASGQLSIIVEEDEVEVGGELDVGVDTVYVHSDGMDDPTSNDDEVVIAGKRKKGVTKKTITSNKGYIKSMCFQ